MSRAAGVPTAPFSVTTPFLVSTSIFLDLMSELTKYFDWILAVIHASSICWPASLASWPAFAPALLASLLAFSPNLRASRPTLFASRPTVPRTSWFSGVI